MSIALKVVEKVCSARYRSTCTLKKVWGKCLKIHLLCNQYCECGFNHFRIFLLIGVNPRKPKRWRNLRSKWNYLSTKGTNEIPSLILQGFYWPKDQSKVCVDPSVRMCDWIQPKWKAFEDLQTWEACLIWTPKSACSREMSWALD